MKRSSTLLLALTITAAMGGCTAPLPDQAEDYEGRRAIIAGTPETGYLGVGALLMDGGGGSYSLCTGTVIATNWVLTAAHCVEGRAAGDVEFFSGHDISRPGTGDYYSVRSLHTHPLYVPADVDAETPAVNDIALVRAIGLNDLPTHAVNEAPLGSGAAGTAVTWVGYGINATGPERGDGVKRRGTGHVDEVYWTALVYSFDTQMPCSGDSGGPMFAEVGGGQRIIGVVSTGDENCAEQGLDTRVDPFAAWITGTMAGAYAPCGITGGDCGQAACWPYEDDDTICYPSEGIAVGSACAPDRDTWTAALPCEDGAICVESPASSGEGLCMSFCATAAHCAGDEICRTPYFTDVPGLGICVPAPTLCDVLGGECPDGEACLPTGPDETDCRESDDLGAGEECNSVMAEWDAAPCGDGLMCARLPGGSFCTPFCFEASTCGDGERCFVPIFSDLEDLGVCTPCIDRDSDGFCTEDDCDDLDPLASPSAIERCNNGVDDDCDGAVDEGCEDCIDADGDGYCADVDCADGDAAVHPSAEEDCGDGVDNDCDGATDSYDVDCGGTPDAGLDAGPDADATEGDTGPGDSGGGDGGGCNCASGGRGAGVGAALPTAVFVLLLWGFRRFCSRGSYLKF